VPQWKSLPIAWILATALVGCSHTTTAGAPQPPPPSSSVTASHLDAGKYPTTPLPPLGDAGSARAGTLIEGRRMAAYVVGPWQADATLTAAGAQTTATVIESFDQLARVVWAPIAGGAYGLPFVVGFSSERQSPGTDPQMSLRNAVLRFADAAMASAAAQNMSARAMSMPRVPSATPIVTAPEQAIPIPGHPDAAGALLTFQEGAQSVRELTVFTSRGPYVLVQVARCASGPDCEAPLAAHTLDLQLPLIDAFSLTAPDQFAALPLDPTGLVARTLPLPPDQATSTSGAAYPPAGALHLEDDPVEADPAPQGRRCRRGRRQSDHHLPGQGPRRRADARPVLWRCRRQNPRRAVRPGGAGVAAERLHPGGRSQWPGAPLLVSCHRRALYHQSRRPPARQRAPTGRRPVPDADRIAPPPGVRPRVAPHARCVVVNRSSV